VDRGPDELTTPTALDARLSCAHGATCGGCPLLHLTYGAQLERKLARVRASASRYPSLAPLLVTAVAAAEPRAGYRTRAKVMVAPGGRVGLFGTGGEHEVVDTPGCIVLAPVLARVLSVLRAWVVRDEQAGEAAPLAPSKGPKEGGLVAIDLREIVPPASIGGAPRVLVTWVVARGSSFRLERLRAAAAELMAVIPEVLGVAVNFHEGEGPQVLGKETMLLAGQASALDALGGSVHRATFGSFVQAHRGQAAHVHARVAAAVFEGREAPRVLDLYGGSGAIALGLAARGAEVRMVESFAPAVDEARARARALGLSLMAEHADVKDALARLAGHSDRFDAAVVNPPRRGLDPEVRTRLARLSLDTVVYVSCRPETLARDLDHFARLGLHASELEPVDMIPLTEEVETVVVLRRGAPLVPRVLYEDDEVLVVDKPPHEPTTPQGEHHRSLLERVRARTGDPSTAAVHRLDVGTSGVVVFAKRPDRVDAWAKAMQADGAQKTYVAAVRGVPEERGIIDRAITVLGKSKPATTRFERARVLGSHALLRVVPDEGRTHQIRRHLAVIGHPVLGDTRYGHAATNRFFVEKHGLDRTFLHAERLDLRHPTSGCVLAFVAPLPGDLASVVESLETTPTVSDRDARSQVTSR
jgi:23S rRNA (uracil1939-C5)-methyltransferase